MLDCTADAQPQRRVASPLRARARSRPETRLLSLLLTLAQDKGGPSKGGFLNNQLSS